MPSDAPCPSGWTLEGTDCWLLVTQLMSFDAARANCVGMGANLATMANAAEQAEFDSKTMVLCALGFIIV